MKKLLIIIVIIITCVSIFLLTSKDQTENAELSIVDETSKVVEFEDTVIEKIKDTSSESQNDSEDGRPFELQVETDEELSKRLEAKEEEFDRLEEEWLTSVKELFIQELNLSEAQFKDYLNMREGLFNDKIEAFEDMHDQMEEKYGESYSYNPTEEELKFDKEIQKRYDDLLLKKIGESAYKKYLELRDETNHKILEETKNTDAAMLMEF